MSLSRPLAIVLALLPMYSPARADTSDRPRFAETPQIEVLGTASESRTPDVISVALVVAASGATSNAALETVRRQTAQLIEAVKTAGIADADTESSGPSTEIVYKRSFDQGGHEIAEKREAAGYKAEFRLHIRSKSLEQVGTLLPRLPVANVLVDSVTFSVSNRREIEQRLEERAIANAVSLAKRQILAAGAKPGRILQIGDPAPCTSGYADLGHPFRTGPSDQDFTFALRPGTSEITVDRRVVMEVLTP